jgi:hypothetical protein
VLLTENCWLSSVLHFASPRKDQIQNLLTVYCFHIIIKSKIVNHPKLETSVDSSVHVCV